MMLELVGAMVFFLLTVFALLFSLTRTSGVEGESFPNRGRYYIGLILWVLASILAVFTSFPGYAEWFMPLVYPILQITFFLLFLTGFFMLLTTVIAFPVHLNFIRNEINGRSGRIALLENIRQITAQPYPVTELFALVLRELASFLVLRKGAVFLINPSRREMYLVAHIGLDKQELSRLERFPIGQDIISRAAMEQTPFMSGDLATSDQVSRKLILAGRNITLSASVVPLVVRDNALGTLMVLSDKPFRFEKPDRMLLGAAAEALAGVVETNRLGRENQKLSARFNESSTRLENLQATLNLSSGINGHPQALESICRNITERYSTAACRIVRLIDGELEDAARFVGEADPQPQSESYTVAIIDAIRRKKMVVLNQEARTAEGGIRITRSTLLSPIVPSVPGEFALLVESPGNSLRLTESFISEVETMTALAAINLNLAGLKESDDFNQNTVRSLLSILKIKADGPDRQIFEQFMSEAEKIVGESTSVMMFLNDPGRGYGFVDGRESADGELSGTFFVPGEGPIGKSAASGDVLEIQGHDRVRLAWQETEPVNQDFFNRQFGEKGLPDYQLVIPIKVLDEVKAVMVVFNHAESSRFIRREKGFFLLAVQLLSIRLSTSRVEERHLESPPVGDLKEAGHIFNRINNDLATVIGRVQLLSRQPDLPGRTRLATDEITLAAESVAKYIKRLQAGIKPPEDGGGGPLQKIETFLKRHHVTGNLYMFDEGKPVRLQKELDAPTTDLPGSEDLSPLIEAVLVRFIMLLEEGDEVFLKSEVRSTHFYISLVRGGSDKRSEFDPGKYDFGEPDVLPRDIIGDELVAILERHRGEVSFDRFGRRPTYLSFRFPLGKSTSAEVSVEPGDGLAGLRILAIDDQQMILDLLSGICQSLGHHLTAMLDPVAGMDKFRRENFDMVMVDLAMGEVSGWDVAREVKLYSPETPVIMITGWGMDLNPEEVRRAGVDFTLTKPFKIEQLTEIIQSARQKHLS